MARLGGGRAADEAEWVAFAARRGGEGLIYAVASTGIHCRAGCPARTPLRENLRLFGTVQEAESCGFRACKRCGGGVER
jgi:AraC family transcriptional regulator of adaptative response/methylated-DNA-[protein]-cysteine methyltransferase